MKKLRIFLTYTILYILTATGVFIYFHLAGKSLINLSDAYEQHINALIVYGKWIRGILSSIIHGQFGLQNYSFGIGYGADFYTSMHYYAVGDPLNLPVAFLPTSAVYYYFQFLILLRPYLAGLTFMSLAAGRGKREERHTEISLMAGALSYAFCGTVLFIGMWNPFFVNAMIIYPLWILGADRILAGDKPNIFIVSVFLGAVSNFYFFYMMVILLIAYVVIRLIIIRKNVIKTLITFLMYGALGTLMASVIFLPVVLAFLSNPRAGLSGHAVALFYDADYYRELLKNLIAYIYKPAYDTEIGLTGIAVPAMLFAFVGSIAGKDDPASDGREGTSAVCILTMALLLLVPVSGYIMTGFSYVINRWGFGLELVICICITDFVDRSLSLGILKRLIISAGSLGYAALLYFIGYKNDELVMGQILVIVAIVIIFMVVPLLNFGRHTVGRVMLTCCALAGILQNAYFANAEEKGNLPNGYVEEQSGADFINAYTLTESNALLEAMTLSPDDYIRYSGRNLKWNSSMLHGISSTQFYFSLANGAVSDFMEKLAVNEMSNFSYFGLDDRMAPLAVTGVNYYILTQDNEWEAAYVPAGYERAGNYYTTAIYKQQNPMSLGFTMDSVMSESEFDELTPVARQEALLGAAVVKDTAPTGFDDADITSADDFQGTYRELDYKLKKGKKIKVNEDNGAGFSVKKDGSKATLSFEAVLLAETYVYLKDLVCDTPYDMVNLTFTAYSGDRQVTTKTLSYKAPSSQFYSGWHNYIVNMGADYEGITKVEIEFPFKGEYSFSELKVYAQPTEPMLSEINELEKESTYDVNLNLNPISRMTNKITANVNAENDSFLVLRIPYDRGWSIWVDGAKQKLVKTDVMLIGTSITAGTHRIELRYRTPGLFIGFLMSAVGIIITIYIGRREGFPKNIE